MEDALELGMEGLDRVTDKYYDKVYDKAKKHNPLSRKSGENNYPTEQSTVDGAPEDQQSERRYRENEKGASRTNSKRSGGAGRPRAQLPSPEPEDRDYYYHSSSQQPDGHNNTSSGTTPRRRAYYDSYYDDDPELERQSETSERVLRAYENEKDDPRRRPDPSLIGSARQRRSRPPKDSEMSYDYDRRPSSQQPRSRHYGDGDSDYDERTGTTHRKTSRGYDDGYDREIIETERYHGVSIRPQILYDMYSILTRSSLLGTGAISARLPSRITITKSHPTRNQATWTVAHVREAEATAMTFMATSVVTTTAAGVAKAKASRTSSTTPLTSPLAA